MVLILKKCFFVIAVFLYLSIFFSNESFSKSNNITTDSFILNVKHKIQEAYKVGFEDISVDWKDDDLGKKIDDLQKFYPNRTIDIRIKDSVIKDISGKQGFPIDVLVNGKPNRIIYLRCKFDVLKEAIVASFKIKRGETISLDNIKYLKVPINKISKNLVPVSTESILGKMVIMDINENTVITSNLLKEKTVVFRGNQVTIRIRNGDLTLTSVGEALQDGYVGQNIPVKISSFSSKKTVMAKILDVSLVEINLGGSN